MSIISIPKYCKERKLDTCYKSSGAAVRKNLVYPAIVKAAAKNEILRIDLDGSTGYTSQFLHEVFGVLVEKGFIHPLILEKHINFLSSEEPYLIDEIKTYMQVGHFRVPDTNIALPPNKLRKQLITIWYFIMAVIARIGWVVAICSGYFLLYFGTQSILSLTYFAILFLIWAGLICITWVISIDMWEKYRYAFDE